jgi:hypothetical protein
LSPTDLTFQVGDALDHLGLTYMLDRPFSVSCYAVPRSTMSASLVLDISDEQLPKLAAAVPADFTLRHEPSSKHSPACPRACALSHSATAFRIDLFLLSDDPHDRERFRRRQEVDFEGRRAWLPTAEDVVITKLRWSRGGRRAKDVEDVAKILAVRGPSLDDSYIRRWADQHGTRELFDRMLSQAEDRRSKPSSGD